MKTLTAFVVLVFVAQTLLFTTISLADDWPRWFGPKMDGVGRETGMIDEFEGDKAKVVWRQPIGGGYGGPSIVGDRAYVMERTSDDGKGIAVENDISKAGEIAGAALDVLPVEPPPDNSRLLGRDDVIFTPHSGFYSEDALLDLQTIVATDVATVLAGGTPKYPISA